MTTSITTIPATRVAPWCGVGKSGSWDSVSEALYEGELDFTVSSSAAYDRYGDEVPGVRVNHSSLTGEIIGVTSDQYGVVQNVDAFSLLDPFCSAGGVIEHAGMTETGMVFMVMHLSSYAFGFAGDEFEVYVCAMNSFNTKYPLALIITPIRVYCQNMFRKLMARGDTALLIKHGRLARDRILTAKAAGTLLLDYESEFRARLECDAHDERTPYDVTHFTELLLPFVPVDKAHPRATFTNDRIRRQRDEFLNDYYHATDNWAYEGSRLGILNAYFDWVSHHVPTKVGKNYEQLRFSNLVNGTAVSNRLLANA
jgi:hypothetical protein